MAGPDARGFRWPALIVTAAGLCLTAPAPCDAQSIRPRPAVSAGRDPNNHAPSGGAVQASDAWYVIRFQEKNVGYERLTESPLRADEAPEFLRQQAATETLRRRTRETRLQLKRFGQDLSLAATLESVEYPDGRLLSWSLRRTAADGVALQKTGAWHAESQQYVIADAIALTERKLMLPSANIARSPVISSWLPGELESRGQQFEANVLFPESSGISTLRFETAATEQRQINVGGIPSVRQVVWYPVSDPELKTRVCFDAAGRILRTEQPLLGSVLTFDRSDAVTAIHAAGETGLDLDRAGVLPVDRQIQNAQRAESIRLQISVGPNELLRLPSSEFQEVQSQSASSLTVRLTRPPEDMRQINIVVAPYVVDANPDDPDLAESHWIDWKSDAVRRIAARAAGSRGRPADQCGRSTTWLQNHLTPSAFSTALKPASEIARAMRGDCTEHAILLAAILRSQGIRSRVTVGFVYAETINAFAPHMWVEARLGDRWIPFDSAPGGSPVGVTHLKVADSDLSDVVTDGTTLFYPLLQLLGRAQVRVLEDSNATPDGNQSTP